MLKKLKWIALTLLLIIIIIIGGTVLYADHLTKIAVETAGSQALGVPTTLDNASLSLIGGSVALENLNVANPTGYQTSHLIKMGNCSTKVKLSTLLEDTIEVEIIKLENLTLTIEQKGLKSNLNEVLANIKEISKKDEPDPKDDTPGKKITLQRIEIIDPIAEIKLLPLPGQLDVLTIELGDITLENVSEDRNKAELTVSVIQAVLVSLAEAVVKSGADIPVDLANALTTSIEGLGNILGDSILGIAGETDKLLQEGTKAIEGLQKGLENIIKHP